MAPLRFEDAFEGAVTVGERGQVVIPATVRERREIHPGDKLLVFSHPEGCGIVFVKLQDVQRMAEVLSPMLAAAEAHSEEHEADAGPVATSQKE